jgi:ubiquitin carboxyl-terminal hydrolase 48
MQGISTADEITEEHAFGACGIGPLSRKQCCPNKFTQDLKGTTNGFGNGNGAARVVIDVDTGTDEIQVIFPCSKARCKSNPYCLNHLGQDKWEDLGQS